MIEGLSVTALKRICNDKGDIYHAMKSSEKSYSNFGEAYFSSIHCGDIKGWKKHTRMVLNLIVPIGAIKFVVFDGRKESCTYQDFFEIIISKDNYCRLTVPSGLWMSFQGVGEDTNLLLNIASLEHDPAEARNVKLDEIQYNWAS